MEKRFLVFLALFVIFAVLPIQSFAISPIQVQLDGKVLNLSTEPISINGRTMLPMKELFQLFGMEVSWEQVTKTVTATSDKNTIRLTIGSNQAIVNGNTTQLDVPATVQSGRTLVPLRFVAESLQAGVAWDSVNRKVIINSDGTVAEVPKPVGYESTVYPAISPNAHPEYIDRASSTSMIFGPGVDIFPEYGGKAGVKYDGVVMQYTPSYDPKHLVTIGEAAILWSTILELNPNSDPRNIPNDVKPESRYYQAFQKLGKTGIFAHLVDQNGNIHPDKAISYRQFILLPFSYWQYSNYDPYNEGRGNLVYLFGSKSTKITDLKEKYGNDPDYDKFNLLIDIGFHKSWNRHYGDYGLLVRNLEEPITNEAMLIYMATFLGRNEWVTAPETSEANFYRPKGDHLYPLEIVCFISRPKGYVN